MKQADITRLHYKTFKEQYFEFDVYNSVINEINVRAKAGENFYYPLGYTEKQLMGIQNQLDEDGYYLGLGADNGCFGIGW